MIEYRLFLVGQIGFAGTVIGSLIQFLIQKTLPRLIYKIPSAFPLIEIPHPCRKFIHVVRACDKIAIIAVKPVRPGRLLSRGQDRRPPLVRGGVRRQQAGHAQRHRHQGRMDQSSRVVLREREG